MLNAIGSPDGVIGGLVAAVYLAHLLPVLRGRSVTLLFCAESGTGVGPAPVRAAGDVSR